MTTYITSNIHGYPLQYTYTATVPLWTGTDYYYWKKCDYNGSVDNSEDILMAQNVDNQSDSDNSNLDPETDINNKKNIASFQCNWKYCNLWFSSLSKLSAHISKEHAFSGSGGLFFCQWKGCSRNLRGFNARYKMLVHVRTHTNEKPHKCTECDKSFSRAENLKIHFRSHSGEKPYVCPIPGCQKAYSNSSDRFKHTRTHQVEKPYFCKIPGCLKRYTDPSSLRKHVKTYRHSIEKDESNAYNKSFNCINSDIVTEQTTITDNYKFLTGMIPDEIRSSECLVKDQAPCPVDNILYSYKHAFTLIPNHRQIQLDKVTNINDKSDTWSMYWNYCNKNRIYNSLNTDTPLDLSINRH